MKRIFSEALLPRLLADPMHDPLRGLDLARLVASHRGELLLVDERRETLTESAAAHLYTVRAPAGHRLNVVCSSTDFRVQLLVIAPSGRKWLIEGARRAGESHGWREILLPEAGEYRVLVTSYEAFAGNPPEWGAYRVRVFADTIKASESSRHLLPHLHGELESARYGVSRTIRTFCAPPPESSGRLP
jgi:hypothetical protein